MKWTHDIPTEPGYYWVELDYDNIHDIVQLIKAERGDHLVCWRLGDGECDNEFPYDLLPEELDAHAWTGIPEPE